MALSVFDMFSIGIGPSSSHTVGPMKAAAMFAAKALPFTAKIHRIKCELYGSLAHTGRGHGSDKAILLGLEGESPETINPDLVPEKLARITKQHQICLMGKGVIAFNQTEDLLWLKRKSLPKHPNGMTFTALDAEQNIIITRTYYSVGGGFVVNDDKDADEPIVSDETQVPYPFTSAKELLNLCGQHQMKISDIMFANEAAFRSKEETVTGLLTIWDVMEKCIKRGCQTDGILPGGLKVKRRARKLYHSLIAEGRQPNNCEDDPLYLLDWVDLYALAVNEENAAGGKVVTAPTNGAAGIIPAVLKYYLHTNPSVSQDKIVRFLLTAAAIGILYKLNASISGAEVGCQGEVGVACSMAAGALTETMGGSALQVENAAEIGMEHNLGLTCDPIGGLVQIPCIERNAMAAVKAINATRIALRGDGDHNVSLDKVIKTMRQTGADMQTKYKETARGGLAVNVIEC
ncbi:MAG: L-serine ammonia-lyase [Gammaproteobacteria bacterium CG22_combo_CG10-13_8_21_14_all_40_8]|nr:MAG: L-serine ammonia-lyase [Gammaproteobacteria bacterium CG22_combo_CG10-13_8_21_14_all_40_8]